VDRIDEVVALLVEIRNLQAAQQRYFEERDRRYSERMDADSKRLSDSLRLQRIAIGRQQQANVIQRVAIGVWMVLVAILAVVASGLMSR